VFLYRPLRRRTPMTGKIGVSPKKKGKSPKERARPVEMILMDVDGTLTDGTLMVLPDGEEVKAYNVRDGLGILLAHLAGIRLGIITGKTSKSLEKRAERLRIYEVHQGILDKKKKLLEILEKHRLTPERVAYIGDDLGDLAVMKSVGLAAAVADAHPEIRKSAHYVCRAAGGKGAVREFIEFVLESQDKWGEIKTRAHEIRNSND
jgi:3-deoxy-D-manno-octulosonate 8-phosphate phosphatase (KDO 8-P phosphatase)